MTEWCRPRTSHTSGATILIILLNDDAVRSNTRKGNVFVSNTLNTTSSARDGLNADTVRGISDGRALDIHSIDGVVSASTNRAWRIMLDPLVLNMKEASKLTDRKTMTS